MHDRVADEAVNVGTKKIYGPTPKGIEPLEKADSVMDATNVTEAVALSRCGL